MWFHFQVLLLEILEQVLLRTSAMTNKVVNFDCLLRHNKLPHSLEAQNNNSHYYLVDFAIWARLSKNLICYPPAPCSLPGLGEPPPTGHTHVAAEFL